MAKAKSKPVEVEYVEYFTQGEDGKGEKELSVIKVVDAQGNSESLSPAEFDAKYDRVKEAAAPKQEKPKK